MDLFLIYIPSNPMTLFLSRLIVYPRISRIMVMFLLSLVAVTAAEAQLTFQRVVVDQNAGDVKLVGDINLDGLPDLVLGGKPDEHLNWYHYPTWTKTVIATPEVEFSTDGALGDIDGDGDPDIIVPDGPEGDNLKWFENPVINGNGQPGNPFDPEQWTQHIVGRVGSWGKDVHIADFDGDGRRDIVSRTNDYVVIFFQTALGQWERVQFFSPLETGFEGMAVGDIDGDGDPDLVLRGVWHRNPGGADAMVYFKWQSFTITNSRVDANYKALVVDLNGDEQLDVLYSSSEGTADVIWCEHEGDPTGDWDIHTIASSVNRAHTLQAADMDGDGDMDVIVGQMHTSQERELAVYLNIKGNGNNWLKQVIDSEVGLHNGVVADIGNDGDYDIFGANWTGNPPLHLWMNQAASSFIGDLDGDGDVDQNDLTFFQICLTGPSLGPPSPGCRHADFDGDHDVDQGDFAFIQRCQSGADTPPSPKMCQAGH